MTQLGFIACAAFLMAIGFPSGASMASGHRDPAPSAQVPAAASRDARAGVLIVELPSGHPVTLQRPELVDARVAPGSVLKIATLVSALEAGIITPATRHRCRRRVTVAGRPLVCVHPDPGRPLTPAEALAYSCNDFFVTVAERIPRQTLSATTVSMGLPAIAPGAPVPLAAVGLAGLEATPRELLRAFTRILDPAAIRLRSDTRAVLVEGLRGAAAYGTAEALGAAGVVALAKTGTAPMPGGGYHGLVVAAVPAASPARAIVVLLPGASGTDAAAVAARALGTHGGQLSAERRREAAIDVPRASGRILRIGRARAGGYDVVDVPLEEYVARVVAGEAAPGSPPAALAAIAVVVRTFAAANLSRHRSDGFDLCDLTHCQVMAAATPATRAAADATAGQVLMSRGKPASVFYTASCGGESELPEDVWPRASSQPFLRPHKEAECRTQSAWTSEISAADLLRALRTAGFRGDMVRGLRVVKRTSSGRAGVLQLQGMVPEEIGGDDLRLVVGRTLGWHFLKSTAFEIKRTASGYRFSGHGFGHGVGLCLVGAGRLAAQGTSTMGILEEYFPGTTIGMLDANHFTRPLPAAARLPLVPGASAKITITMPLADEHLKGSVGKLIADDLAGIAARAAVPQPDSVTVIFHPTVESYCRQTGQPWWTAAATSGERIDLLPPSVLRERRILESTVRHEVAHLLTAGALAGRPEWVKEGAAIHFAGERFDPAPHALRASAGCPSDDELRRSRSAAALQDAYARASSCFAAGLARGLKWSEIR